MYSFWDRFKSGMYDIIKSRSIVVIILFCVLAAVLLQRTFYLQIVKGRDYFDDYKLQIQKTRKVQGTRGKIRDRNGKVLAYNELAYAVTIEDNGDYDTTAQKNKELNKVVSTVIQMVESNGDTVINDFGIVLDADGNYKFVADNETQRLRFVADVYGKKTIDKLSDRQKNESAEDIIHYLCTDEAYGYGLDEDMFDKAAILKLVNVRYAISLNGYQKFIPTTIAEDISEETVADIMENLDSLQGVDIQEESLRRYTDSKYFASIIGYTGQISQEEYDALSKDEQKKYSLTDTVGKSGLEKTMNSDLQGENGEMKLYVNNVGKVIETVKGKEAKAGNDLYLSIDADLQRAAYNIIEQELAGILLTKLSDTLDYDRTQVEDGSDVIIPVGDVYNTFLANDILDMNHFKAEDAKAAETEVYGVFSARKAEVIEEIRAVLQDAGAGAYRDQTKEMQAYLNYIVSDVLTTTEHVIMPEAVDTNDDTYKAWRDEESINIYTYLNYAISKNWVDASKLKNYVSDKGEYSASNELYEGLAAYITDYITSDHNFDKLVYRYMIKSGAVSGRQVCMMLYEQGVLPFDEAQYNQLNSGGLSAYDFIRSKIQDLSITPGQIALEPCTGSLVMTNVNTGEVLACVSYPGYDNNRLANTMDSDYYNKLLTDQARPFYNNATQEKTAPGSTYKPLVAVAGLTEGVIDTNTYLDCHGVYKKVEPNPKCWIYPLAHGALNVEGAIENSCNDFFYEVGYRMSLTNGLDTIASDDDDGNASRSYYSSDQGTDALKKYAMAFGLGDTSGLEIPESEPQISDEASVPSAIGQGTNNYTTSQLARYVTTVANKGTVYDLTLLSRVETPDGEVVKQFQAEVENTVADVAPSTWEAVHNGMRSMVISNGAIFSELNTAGFQLSGKSGTAQQSKTHPDHGLFIGFAPSDKPEVAFATRIANGYTSLYTSEIGRDIMKYYYGLNPEEEIISGSAANIDSSATLGD